MSSYSQEVADTSDPVDGSPSAAGQAVWTRSGKWPLLVVTAVLALLLDLMSKRAVAASFDLGAVHEIFPFLSLQFVYNRGVAFGMLSGRTILIVAVAAVAVLVIVAYAVYERRPLPAGLGGGLLLGGSLGNFVERIVSGQVTDFIKFPYWPNFNLADVFIFVGVAIVAVYLVADIVRGEAHRSP